MATIPLPESQNDIREIFLEPSSATLFSILDHYAKEAGASDFQAWCERRMKVLPRIAPPIRIAIQSAMAYRPVSDPSSLYEDVEAAREDGHRRGTRVSAVLVQLTSEWR